ncbi:MAG: VOC family protein [Thermodesulfobacteriota bacterium]|jgi:predicted enzyme related to lactoylglutathione lyase|nr:MAG: VOC family protein [Thermodesulfobacteriota bacterium]
MPEKVNANFIDHISIACLDVLKAEQDYMQIFGWEVVERYFDPDSHINVSCFKVGPTMVEVMEDEYSGGWYELQDISGKVVISGMGNATKWVPRKDPKPEGKMADVGYWISKVNNGREGVQLISINVDDVNQEGPKIKANGGALVPEKLSGTGKEVRFWPDKGRNYAFIHPKRMHGALWEVIDGKYSSQK